MDKVGSGVPFTLHLTWYDPASLTPHWVWPLAYPLNPSPATQIGFPGYPRSFLSLPKHTTPPAKRLKEILESTRPTTINQAQTAILDIQVLSFNVGATKHFNTGKPSPLAPRGTIATLAAEFARHKVHLASFQETHFRE